MKAVQSTELLTRTSLLVVGLLLSGGMAMADQNGTTSAMGQQQVPGRKAQAQNAKLPELNFYAEGTGAATTPRVSAKELEPVKPKLGKTQQHEPRLLIGAIWGILRPTWGDTEIDTLPKIQKR